MRVGHRAALPSPDVSPGAGEQTTPDDTPYDPGAHTIADVLAYLDEHPDQLESIYLAELDGKNRPTLTAKLEARGA